MLTRKQKQIIESYSIEIRQSHKQGYKYMLIIPSPFPARVYINDIKDFIDYTNDYAAQICDSSKKDMLELGLILLGASNDLEPCEETFSAIVQLSERLGKIVVGIL